MTVEELKQKVSQLSAEDLERFFPVYGKARSGTMGETNRDRYSRVVLGWVGGRSSE